MFDIDSFLRVATGRIPAIVFALCFHEAAHAWAALKCGDDTAARMGRITLNPLSHLDPIGSIGIVFAFFGWGRPVPYVERNLRNPRRDAMLIAIAGPASNIMLAFFSGIIFRGLVALSETSIMESEVAARAVLFLVFLMGWSVAINLFLAFFNMIPVFPLDGEKVVVGLLPYEQARAYSGLRQFGPMLLLMLIFMGGSLVSRFVFLFGGPLCYLFSGVGLENLLYLVHVDLPYRLW